MQSSGDIGAAYETVLRELKAQGFTEEKLAWPNTMTLKRGKRGMLAKNMREVKTTLNVSFKQSNSTVHTLFEYNLGIPSAFVNKNSSEFNEDLMKIKHALVEPHKEESTKTCDVCLNAIQAGESFCKNCGRSSKPDTTPVNSNVVVKFDEDRIQFGLKPVDDALYGGLQKNSVVLISSPALEEKNILISRFIESGLADSEIVVNVSDGTKQNQELALNNKYFQIICNNHISQEENNPNKANNVYLKDAERLTEVSMALTSILNNISKIDSDGSSHKRLVIDIVSDVLLTNKSVNTRKWLRETISKFKSKNFTILAVLNPLMHPTEETQALFDLFEGKIDIYETEENGEDKITLKIKRLDNVKYSSKGIELVREDLLIKPNTAQ